MTFREMEDIYKSQRHRKLPGVYKLLSKIYSKLQLYSKTIEWTQRQEGMNME